MICRRYDMSLSLSLVWNIMTLVWYDTLIKTYLLISYSVPSLFRETPLAKPSTALLLTAAFLTGSSRWPDGWTATRRLVLTERSPAHSHRCDGAESLSNHFAPLPMSHWGPVSALWSHHGPLSPGWADLSPPSPRNGRRLALSTTIPV